MQARPAYWLMLALAIIVSAGLRVLALRAQADNNWQPAIYRYPADGLPACADLAGHIPIAPLAAGHWSRMRLPQLQWRSPRGCVLNERVPM